MTRFSFFFISLLFCFSGLAQDRLFILHPAVGDTIDQTEKTDYLLFPEMSLADFKSAFITQNGDSYLLNVLTENDSVIIAPLSPDEIEDYQIKIEKLLAYYANRAQQDSARKAQKLTLDAQGLHPEQFNGTLVSPGDQKQIQGEVRQATRMKEDAERRKQFEDGTDIFGGGARIEFFRTKSKKKKK